MELVRLIAAAFTGNVRTAEHFESLIATECSIRARSSRQGVSLDGELSVLATPLLFRTCPGILRVLVPAQ